MVCMVEIRPYPTPVFGLFTVKTLETVRGVDRLAKHKLTITDASLWRPNDCAVLTAAPN